MKIFVAGATGAIGRRLLPMLLDAGHDVVGTTRTPDKVAWLRSTGAEPVVLDALDGDAVHAAVGRAAPDVIVHQLTAISGSMDLRHFDEWFATTNRLRTEGTDHLLAAAGASGVARLVAQSFTGPTNPRTGGPVKTEDDPIDPDPVPIARQTVAAIAHLERAVTTTPGVDGLALRYGWLYGPGTGIAEDGDMAAMVAARRFPIVGRGTGISSFVHVDDAAEATAIAVERGAPGIYNIVDDDPAPVAEWLPQLASALGAKPPRRVPTWLARLLVGPYGVAVMTQARGSSNAKARRELDWKPRFASWREGFVEGL